MTSDDEQLKAVTGTALAALRSLSDELNSSAQLQQALLNSDEVSAAIAETNADGWILDDIDVCSVEPCYAAGHMSGLRARIDWNASGDQDPDRAYCGTSAKGTAVVCLEDDGTLTVEDVSGYVIRPEGPEEPEGDLEA